MAVDERARHELYEQLTGVLGAEASGTLMELLPSVGWPEFATHADVETTKRELAAIGSVLRSDIAATKRELAATRSELKTEIAATKRELAATRSELKTEIAVLRGEMNQRFETVDASITAAKNELLTFRGELVAAVSAQTRTIVFTMAGSLVAFGGLALSLARFG